MNQQRINYSKEVPESIKGLLEIEKYVEESGLDRTIFELAKYRASQINGCAYCMDMHTKDARAAAKQSSAYMYFLPGGGFILY